MEEIAKFSFGEQRLADEDILSRPIPKFSSEARKVSNAMPAGDGTGSGKIPYVEKATGRRRRLSRIPKEKLDSYNLTVLIGKVQN